MPTANTTPNQGYQLPDSANDLSDDVLRLIAAIGAVDADVAAAFAALATKAAAAHGHTIADVTSLQNTLDGKAASGHAHSLNDLSNVDDSSSIQYQFLMKSVTGWIPTKIAASHIESGTLNSARLPTIPEAKLPGHLTSAAITASLALKANLSGATFTGDVGAKILRSSQSVGTEGGQVNLAKPASGTSFTADVALDVAGTSIRLLYNIGNGTRSVIINGLEDLSGTLWHTGNLPGIGQTEAQDGTATSYRAVTALRMKQAAATVISTNKTASCTLVIGNLGQKIRMNSASATTVTVPLNSSVPFAVGSTVYVERVGAGAVTIANTAGVTIVSVGNKRDIADQNGTVALHKDGTNHWSLLGPLA